MGFLGRVSNGVRQIGRTAGGGLMSIGRVASGIMSGAGRAAQEIAAVGRKALQLAEALPILKNIPLVQGMVGVGKSAINSVELAGDLARTTGAAGRMLTSKFEKS